MRIKFQEIIRVVCFTTVFLLLLTWLSDVFIPKWEGKRNAAVKVASFYQQPKNSIDVLFIGASSFRSGLSPLLMWEQHGITSYLRVSSRQSPIVSYYYLVESLKTQSPKLVVLDAISLFQENDIKELEPYFRNSIDPMKLSVEKTMIASYIASHSESQNIVSYWFPLLRYHSRWKEITADEFRYSFIKDYDYLRGAYPDFTNTPLEYPIDYMAQIDETAQVEDDALLYFQKTIELCQKNNIQVMLLTIPRLTWTYSKHAAVQQMADQYGLIYLDYSFPESINEIGLDAATDFFDKNHLNVLGSSKISVNLGTFLQETYGIPDRRNDAGYELWNIDLQRYTDLLSENGLSHLSVTQAGRD